MYRRRSRIQNRMTLVILGGIVAGIIYFILDQERTPPDAGVDQVETTSSSIPAIAGSEQTPGSPSVEDLTTSERPSAISRTIAPQQSELFIPTLAVKASIVEIFHDGGSWDVSRLAQNVGHLQGTAWFNIPGNIALAGHVEHSDGRTGVFANLLELNIGDPVIVTENGEERQFAVTEVKVVAPDDLSVLYPTETDRVTLITCGAYSFALDTYQERIVVVAERIS